MSPGLYFASMAAFKRQFLEAALLAHDGNRLRTARTLGLRRTYLQRLIREARIGVPAPPRAAIARGQGRSVRGLFAPVPRTRREGERD